MAAFEAESDPEFDAITTLERERVHRGLWQISDEQRMAITLVDLAGFSTSDAAQILKVPRGTILSRLHRGRKALAALLAEGAPDPERLEGESGP